jgi:hypothetical protein
MKIYKSLIIAAAITPIIPFTTALAASKGEVTRAVTHSSGVVYKIDRTARTLLVRDENGRMATVHVPEGTDIGLSRIGNLPSATSTVSFEQAHIGLRVNLTTEQ